MRVKVKGRLQFHFHGGSSVATAALLFTEQWHAEGFASKRTDWKAKETASRKYHAAIATLSSEQLAQLKSELSDVTFPPCGWSHCPKSKCSARQIDELTHSVDYGPEFDAMIEVGAHPDQKDLPL